MPILQSKLVMRSIEALLDEALAETPDTANHRGAIDKAPPTILPATNSPHESSADATVTSNNDHDIMARIDSLLKKLDEKDDPVMKLPSASGALTKTDGMADHSNSTTANYSPIPNRAAQFDETTVTRPNASRGSSPDDMTDDTKIDNIKTDNIEADRQTDVISGGQSQTLADIAAAIHQAQQKEVNTAVTDACENNPNPFNMDVLSDIFADEIRRTVTEVISAQLPQIVRDAVSETIRTLPANTSKQSKQAAIKTSPAKNTSKSKTSSTKKVETKKAAGKKKVVNKATKKTALKKSSKSP